MATAAGTDKFDSPGRVPVFGSEGMRATWIDFNLQDGDPKLLAPPATHRSWVTVRRAADAIELTASFERAPDGPMGDFHPDFAANNDRPFALFHSTGLSRSPP